MARSIWVAYYQDSADWDVAIFFEEIEALRFAVGKIGYNVQQMGAGSVQEQIKEPVKFDNKPQPNQPKKEKKHGNKAQINPAGTRDNSAPAPQVNPALTQTQVDNEGIIDFTGAGRT